MGTRASRQRQQHHSSSDEKQAHATWDHRIASAGDNIFLFANQEIQKLQQVDKFILPSPASESILQGKPLISSSRNGSAREKRRHELHTSKQMLGIRKSRSTGNLSNAHVGITVHQLSNNHAKRRERYQSSASQTSVQSFESSIISHAVSATNFKGKKIPLSLQLALIDAKNLKNGREIGKGKFSTVYHGLYKGTRDVAIKQLNAQNRNIPYGSADDFSGNMHELLQEAYKMTRLKHSNVLRIIGVTFFGDRKQLSLVTDFMKNGSLLDYLKKNREIYHKSHPSHITRKINYFASQIYEAMVYLEDRNIIHRDLAARNCLIGEGEILKVGDFGLSKLVDCGLYKGTYKTICEPRWTSPEAFFSAKYSSRSDVWSYGITLWEIYSLGDRPFGNMNTYALQVVLRNSSEILSRYLPKPRPFATDEVYTDIILACLTYNAAMRPRFRDLRQRIFTILTQRT